MLNYVIEIVGWVSRYMEQILSDPTDCIAEARSRLVSPDRRGVANRRLHAGA
jgi:hypothetical protein